MAKLHERGLHLSSSISSPPAKASSTWNPASAFSTETAPVQGTMGLPIAKLSQLLLAIFLNFPELGSYDGFLKLKLSP